MNPSRPGLDEALRELVESRIPSEPPFDEKGAWDVVAALPDEEFDAWANPHGAVMAGCQCMICRRDYEAITEAYIDLSTEVEGAVHAWRDGLITAEQAIEGLSRGYDRIKPDPFADPPRDQEQQADEPPHRN